jgi:class 3 adenylate cyclase
MRVEAHTPQYLADRILRARAAIQGERKQVTMMFADVRGSFEMIEGTDPESAQALFDSTIRLMVAAIHRYDGTVAQILGDGVVAIFGAPLAHEDHAVRAAYAALAMQEAARTRVTAPDASAALRPEIRIGLNSGEVVIGAIGNDLSVNYRAVGPTTHMAARMEQTASPGTTRLTGETLRLAGGLIQVRALGPTMVKGVSHPVEIYELVGRTNRTRFQAHIDRGLSPFVGREIELDALRTTLNDVRAGTSHTVVIEGETGFGKSRLCHELVSDAAAAGCDVLETNATAYSHAPFAMLGQLFRAVLEVAPGAPAAVLEGALDAELARLPQLAGARSALASVLDLPLDDPDWLGLDPAARRQRSFEAMRAVLAARFVERPLILIIEDLHWFDEESRAFVRTLVDESPPGRRLVLVTHRSELQHEWGRAPDCVCRLLPLSESSSRALAASLVGGSADLEPVRRKLVERTDGNPFFIEESVRAMAESGVLTGLPGAYALVSPKVAIEIPPSVESVIAARIDRMAPLHKELLRAAAVIGDEMPHELLQTVLGLTDDEFRARLGGAEVLGILVEAKLFPTRLCRFRHSLSREVLYRQMLSPQRMTLHARAVVAIETLYADRLGEHTEMLALHAFEGGLWEKASEYHLRACVRAATRWANRDAVSLLDRGLQCVEHLREGDERTRFAIDLRLSGFAALLPLGDQSRMLSLLREAETMAEALGDRRRLGAAYSQLATTLWMAGRHDPARESAGKALALAQDHGICVTPAPSSIRRSRFIACWWTSSPASWSESGSAGPATPA